MEFIHPREYIRILKSSAKIVISLLGIASLTTQVRGVVNDTATVDSSGGRPYSAIWLRNVFDLKPIPVVSNEPVKVNEPPPNVHLTGITTILGTKKALFMVQKKVTPGKGPQSAEESYILKEGQREGPLEVLEINTAAATVKIKLEDVVSTITFETNKMTSTSAGGPGGGMDARPGYPRVTPGFGGSAYPNRSAFPTPATYSPTPPGQSSMAAPYPTGGFGGYASPNTGSSGNSTIPSPSSGSTAASIPNAPTQTSIAPPTVTDQERALIAAAESAIKSGTTTVGGTGGNGPAGLGSAPSIGSISTINIPPVPTTPPPPLPAH